MKSPLGLLSGRILPLVAVVTALVIALPARATLLTPANEAQLEFWLGQGDLNFTSLFTKVAGDGQTSAAFHSSVDHKGATFTLMEISGGNFYHRATIIGGYNPDSWDTTAGWTMRLTEADRHAFLFNLTSGVKQHQNLNGQGWSGYFSSGDYETVNLGGYGATFGGGYDLYSSDSLEYGSAYNFSYGGTSFGTNIAGDLSSNTTFVITRYEVYGLTVGAAAVPDGASTAGLLMLSGTALLAWRRRFAVA